MTSNPNAFESSNYREIIDLELRCKLIDTLPIQSCSYGSCTSHRFDKEADFFDNISCFNAFLSGYRDLTFDIQSRLRHAKCVDLYELVQSGSPRTKRTAITRPLPRRRLPTSCQMYEPLFPMLQPYKHMTRAVLMKPAILLVLALP